MISPNAESVRRSLLLAFVISVPVVKIMKFAQDARRVRSISTPS